MKALRAVADSKKFSRTAASSCPYHACISLSAQQSDCAKYRRTHIDSIHGVLHILHSIQGKEGPRRYANCCKWSVIKRSKQLGHSPMITKFARDCTDSTRITAQTTVKLLRTGSPVRQLSRLPRFISFNSIGIFIGTF